MGREEHTHARPQGEPNQEQCDSRSAEEAVRMVLDALKAHENVRALEENGDG